ncbi:MAG: hypothetical protein M3422_03740, partial [Actinomycetota bacterium]|nr:hypothetical protein [Actinomycetota bacterium]
MGEWYGNYFEDGINWDAVPHQQLYDWFTQVPADSLRTSVQAWIDNIGSRFQAAADKVTDSLRAAGVHWEGAAADSMRESSAPLAAHALAAKDAAMSVAQTTTRQAATITEMEYAMPEPVPAPQQKDLLSMVGSPALVQHLVDVHEQERAAAEAEARARDLARNYDAGTDEAISGLPRFEVAPTATVSKA